MSYKFKGRKVIINGEEQIIVPGVLPVDPSNGHLAVDSSDNLFKMWNQDKNRWIALGDAEDIVFDNTSNTFVAETVQEAIEEIADTLIPNLTRFGITTTFNSTVSSNQWLGYSELLPGNTTPIIIPKKCKLQEITFSWTSVISIVGGIVTITGTVDGRFDLYKNGTAAGNIVYQKTFANAGAGGIGSSINISLNAGDFIIGRWVDSGDNPSDAAICYFFQPV